MTLSQIRAGAGNRRPRGDQLCGAAASGERVTLYMPMVPELVVTMLACARLGVIHSQVSGGFSGTTCGRRIVGSGSRILITIDGFYHAGQLVDHKVKADEAVEAARQEGQQVEEVLVRREQGRLHRRAAHRLTGAGHGAGAGRGTVVPDARHRHHRPPQRLHAQHGRASG